MIKNNKEIVFITFVLSIIMFGWYLVLGGIMPAHDSIKYLSGTDILISGDISDLSLKQIMMLSYLIFVGFHHIITDNNIFIISSQCLLFVMQGVFLWTVFKNYCSNVSAWGLIILYFSFIHLVRWNYYVLTDSLAITGSMFIAWLLHQVYTRQSFSVWPYIPLLCFIAFIRPNMMLIVISFLVFWVYNKAVERQKPYHSLYILLFMSITTFLILYILYQGRLDSIISAVLHIQQSGKVGPHYAIDMPSLHIVNGPALTLLNYIWENIISIIKMFFLRIYWYLIMIRPYYSIASNIFLIFFATFIYGLAFIGFISKGHRRLKIGLLLLILSNIVFIGMTYPSWDSRYVMYILPFLWVSMSFGVYSLEQLSFVKKLILRKEYTNGVIS